MHRTLGIARRTVLALALLLLPPNPCAMAEHHVASDVVLGVHGGTGLAKKDLTPELEAALRGGLAQALRAGQAAARKPGASSLDAVEAAIRTLEDSPHFNAGRGAVFTHDGRNELDASIMEGRHLRAGAVAGVTTIKNPITAARAVMERTRHVMLVGRGAEAFADEAGLEIVEPTWFWTQRRWDQLQRQLEQERRSAPPQGRLPAPPDAPRQWSTVGAVAIDEAGNLAAGTSTGGMSGKRFGRVGDSPIIGAGTYADNSACAVSCTGHGEFFIRYAVAHEIAALIKHKGAAVDAAADQVINGTLRAAGGEGAAIALDPRGRFVMAYNSEGLYRGWVTRDGTITVRLYEP